MSRRTGRRGGPKPESSRVPNEVRSKVDHIHSIFPDWAKEDILRSLEEHDFNSEAVVEYKLKGREEWTEVKKKKTAAEIKAQKRSVGGAHRGARGGSGRGGARESRPGRGRGRAQKGEPRPAREGAEQKTDQQSATAKTDDTAAAATTTTTGTADSVTPSKTSTSQLATKTNAAPAPEPQPAAVPAKPSFADILKKSVRKEEPEQSTTTATSDKAPQAADESAATKSTQKRAPATQRARPRGPRDAVPKAEAQSQPAPAPAPAAAAAATSADEAAAKPATEPERQTNIVEQPAIAKEEVADKTERTAKQTAPQRTVESSPSDTHTQQPAAPAPVQTQTQQHIPISQPPTASGDVSNLILPATSSQFLKGSGPLDLQFGSMGISDDQQVPPPPPQHQQQHQQQSEQSQQTQSQPQQQVPHAGYQVSPSHIQPQIQQFPPPYGWPGQQFGDQTYQTYFNQYGQPQQPPQQAGSSSNKQPEKQDGAPSKQTAGGAASGFQQGSNKYVQANPNPYAQMGSPQFGFPTQYGYNPYLMPNAMQFQGYPGQGYAPGSGSKNYPFYNKQNIYGYHAGASGHVPPPGMPYGAADGETHPQQEQEGYGKQPQHPQQQQQQQQQPKPHQQPLGYDSGFYQHNMPQYGQPHQQKPQRGGGKPSRRGDQNTSSYGAGYPGSAYGGYAGYGPSGYPYQQYYHAEGGAYGAGNPVASRQHHHRGKDQQDQGQSQQQQQQQPQSRHHQSWN